MTALLRRLLLLTILMPGAAMAQAPDGWLDRFNQAMFTVNRTLGNGVEAVREAMPDALTVPEPVRRGAAVGVDGYNANVTLDRVTIAQATGVGARMSATSTGTWKLTVKNGTFWKNGTCVSVRSYLTVVSRSRESSRNTTSARTVRRVPRVKRAGMARYRRVPMVGP